MTEYDQDGNLLTETETFTVEDEENTPFAKRLRGQINAATKRAEKAERALAIRNADLRTRRADGSPEPVYDLFVKAYDGALDPESVRTAASAYGLADPSPEHGIPADEAAAIRRTQALGNDSQSPVLNQVTEADFNEMSMPQRQQFLRKHPEAHDAWSAGRPYTIG